MTEVDAAAQPMGRGFVATCMGTGFEARLLASGILVYCALFLAFYPPIHGIEDEVGFLNQAIVWSGGALSAEGAGLEQVGDFMELGGRHVGWRNPGRSLVLIPFLALGGQPAAFLSGALIHVALTLLAAWALRRLSCSPAWALLVLAHPTLALYSRTVMSDPLGGLGVLAAFAALTSRSRPGLLAGLAIGLATVARYQLGVLLPGAALAAFLLADDRRRGAREAAWCLAAGAAMGVALLAYNTIALGEPFGVSFPGRFSAAYVPANAAHYATCLLLLWPGMALAWPLAPRRARTAALALTLPLLALLLAYYWVDRRPSALETLVVGQRLLAPALPVWIVLYALVLQRLGARWVRTPQALRRTRAAAVAASAALLIATGAMFARHDRHLEGLAAARAEALQVVPGGALVLANRTFCKLVEVLGAEGAPYRLRYYQHAGRLIEHPEAIRAERQPWYVVHLLKAGEALPPAWDQLVGAHPGQVVPTSHPRLAVYRVHPKAFFSLDPERRP